MAPLMQGPGGFSYPELGDPMKSLRILYICTYAVCIRICVYVYVYLCIYIYVYVCKYRCIYVYRYTYIYICICMYDVYIRNTYIYDIHTFVHACMFYILVIYSYI